LVGFEKVADHGMTIVQISNMTKETNNDKKPTEYDKYIYNTIYL